MWGVMYGQQELLIGDKQHRIERDGEEQLGEGGEAWLLYKYVNIQVGYLMCCVLHLAILMDLQLNRCPENHEVF